MPHRLLSHLDSLRVDPFETVFADAPVLMHCIDADGRLLNVSRFWADCLGYDRDEMIGRRSTDFLTEESRRYATDTVLPEFFSTGRIDGIAYDFVRRDGEVMHMILSATSQYDETGAFARSLAVLYDNTDARRATEMLARSQRLDTIGQMAGGVAHDFNNLLSVIQGNLELLRDLPETAERERCLDDALKATARGAALTQQLLSFGRRARLAPVRLALVDAVEENCSLMRRLLPANISLEFDPPQGLLGDVRLDPHQLQAALLNLAVNARDAMPMGGRLRIRLTPHDLTGREAKALSDTALAGRYVALEVADDGVGMSASVSARAFDPFFTTKPVGEGSGLGLSMVLGFATQSGGGVRLTSRSGAGTRISMLFPAEAVRQQAPADAPPTSPAPAVRAPDAGADPPTIMVVEDETPVRRVIVTQLRAEGFKVVEAESGDGGYARLLAGLRPDLILTDRVMPGAVQGDQLIAFARGLDPSVRAIMITGYGLEEGDACGTGRLAKPVARARLIEAVRDALGRRAHAACGAVVAFGA